MLPSSILEAFRKSLPAAVLAASLSAGSGELSAQLSPSQQQAIQAGIERQRSEMDLLNHQHEEQRNQVTQAIEVLSKTSPGNNVALQKVHSQLAELQKRQEAEKKSLDQRQRGEMELLRQGKDLSTLQSVVRKIDPDSFEADNERVAGLSFINGFQMRDARGTPVNGSVTILVNGRTFDVDVAIAGLSSAADASRIEIRYRNSDRVVAQINGMDLRPVAVPQEIVVPGVVELLEPSPEWLLTDTGFAVTDEFLTALDTDGLEVIVRSSAYPSGLLRGTFGVLDPDKLRKHALNAATLPVPVVVDRSFKRKGTLNELVIQDEVAAIQLGKALFWDMQVGSDNRTACATCHNFGGADWRTRNQLHKGGNRDLTLADFMDTADGGLDDIIGSQGVIQKNYAGVNPPGEDIGTDPGAALNPSYTIDGTAKTRTRQVTGRNTPSVINAAFYARQFWDGRAHRYFNGENIFGSQDPDAGVWEYRDGHLSKNTNFLVDFSSLASQAVGPVGSSVEMSHGPDGARSLPDIGRKLLDARVRPLGLQKVHAQDSVLASLASAEGKGLNTSYAELVRKAFRPEYWNCTDASVNGHTQMEANFGLFFGLAVQAYERTLISDQSRFDKFVRGEHVEFSYDEKEGLLRYFNSGVGCTVCHAGPMFSSADWSSLTSPVEAMGLANTTAGFYDNGFYNIGVQDQKLDAGVGRMDLPFGPISLSKLASGLTSPSQKVPAASQWPSLAKGLALPAKVEGMFKTPTLRNVELTAPYFHTGNHATLEDSIEFYAVGGDFRTNEHLDDDIHRIAQLADHPDRIHQLAAFMRTLTDERVRFRSAPFDHPELTVPNGHVAGANGMVLDNLITLEATGASGAESAFPMFTDRLGATVPLQKSGSTTSGALASSAASSTASKDLQMSELNRKMNELQQSLNNETQTVNQELNNGAITAQQQNAKLTDINDRRSNGVRQLTEMMAMLNSSSASTGTSTAPSSTSSVAVFVPSVSLNSGSTTTSGSAASGDPAATATWIVPILNVGTLPQASLPGSSISALIEVSPIIVTRSGGESPLLLEIPGVPLSSLSRDAASRNSTLSPSLVTGVTAEFLTADGEIEAISTRFIAEPLDSGKVTLRLRVESTEFEGLPDVTHVRIVQSLSGSLGVAELATLALVETNVAATAPAAPR